MAPFRRGPLVEGTLGVYAPTGTLKNLSAPGPWLRLALGWDFTRWLAVYAAGDVAFLSTGRAPPPPGERGYMVWGFGGGLKLSLPIGERVRIPLRAELGMHRVADDGVLVNYGYASARDLGFSYGAMLGFEWRAASRHYGLAVEAGIRNDSALAFPGKSQSPFAILGGVTLHYTL